jgi:hypothetical protein
MTELNELLILAQSELPDYLVKDFGQYPLGNVEIIFVGKNQKRKINRKRLGPQKNRKEKCWVTSFRYLTHFSKEFDE